MPVDPASVPGAQAGHCVAPRLGLARPIGHGEHALPAFAENRPAAHWEQVEEPAADPKPAEQGVQVAALNAPKVPAGQGVQTPLLFGTEPLAQAWPHDALPELIESVDPILPVGQAWHAPTPLLENLVGGQGVQVD